ncbi:hypothetical protein [Hymenobacter sedentarius]|uniref:hypothetical protein n=1 Tax=Hymenobacter sedentarius TaxID=1411621 RepID=UPI000AF87F10|nr:hypothetical protein [Hymenobacter sedentarius]
MSPAGGRRTAKARRNASLTKPSSIVSRTSHPTTLRVHEGAGGRSTSYRLAPE